jgi:hypothetical protein
LALTDFAKPEVFVALSTVTVTVAGLGSVIFSTLGVAQVVGFVDVVGLAVESSRWSTRHQTNPLIRDSANRKMIAGMGRREVMLATRSPPFCTVSAAARSRHNL